MQEGMASLVQMPAAVVAQRAHAAAGLLQVAVFGHPTTGGVFASFANLADVSLAVDGATMGFAGPRVAEALAGAPLPSGSHTARGALAAGLVDAVVDEADQARMVTEILRWSLPSNAAPVPEPPRADGARVAPWEAVEQSRATDRPRARAFMGATSVAAELRGDRAGSDDPSIRVLLGWVHGRRVVVIAMDRAANDARVTPAGYRKAWRGIALADRLGVPLVTLVDTPGADATAASEAGGIAHHIARTFDHLLACGTPTVCLVIGEGGSGGALALAATDRLLIQERATFSVIAPEGAAAILHRDASRASEVAGLLDPTSWRLAELGIADQVVAEPDGEEVTTAWAAVARAIDDASGAGEDRLAQRAARWRHPLDQ
jgi:acetyl-CoA carboxylase carboxyl transferase subunit beta